MDFAGPVRQATNPNDRRLFVHLRRECRAWETREGRELDRTGILEIATKLKVPVGHLERQLDRMTRADLAIDQSPAVAEMLPVDSAEEAVTTARSRAKAVAIIETALASLSERDRRVFELRFVAEHTPTRLEIGDRLGISKERVRQLEERALKAVRGALAAAGIHDLAAVA
jgi:RNA polymerase sigma-32 factor